MSGSPILQDNKIIGVVNYVVVEEPLKGDNNTFKDEDYVESPKEDKDTFKDDEKDFIYSGNNYHICRYNWM